MDIYYIKDMIELLSGIAILLGIPVTVYQYISSIKDEKLRYQYKIYDELDNKYIDFQKLCLEYPFLNIFEVNDKRDIELNSIQKKQELIAFTILISIFERAYFMCHSRCKNVDFEHWFVWDDLINKYCEREIFRNVWHIVGGIWDDDFKKDIDKRILKNEKLNKYIDY